MWVCICQRKETKHWNLVQSKEEEEEKEEEEVVISTNQSLVTGYLLNWSSPNSQTSSAPLWTS